MPRIRSKIKNPGARIVLGAESKFAYLWRCSEEAESLAINIPGAAERDNNE